MPFHYVRIPVRDPESAENELNAFLRAHRILGVSERWVEQGDDSFWALRIDYSDRAAATKQRPDEATDRSGRPKVDYREKLSPDQFAVYSRLRDVRRTLAKADGVALYVVFTNEQLATMVEGRVTTMEELSKIPGVGGARLEKYGAAMLEVMNEWLRGKPDEKSGKTV